MRLRVITTLSFTVVLVEFQFHIGAIKSYSPYKPNKAAPQFQFHIGAIKSAMIAAGAAMVAIFQFHIGAIKSASSVCAFSRIFHFNSTLVRLRDP